MLETKLATPNTVENKKCDCHEFIIQDEQRGEQICSGCGLVLSEHNIDWNREGRRAFSSIDQSNRSQTGSPITVMLPDISMSTVIRTHGYTVTPQFRRIVKWNSRLSWEKQNLLIATTEIKRMSTHLFLPLRVKELASQLYRKVMKKNLLRGRSIHAMVVASLYCACRIEKIPRTLLEIMNYTDIKGRSVRRAYKTMVNELNLTLPHISARNLVPMYSYIFNFDTTIEYTAIKLIDFYSKYFSVSGKDPKGILAAAIYLSTILHKKKISQQIIANEIQVTEVTLRSRFKEMEKLTTRKK